MAGDARTAAATSATHEAIWSGGLAAVMERLRALRARSAPFALCFVTHTEGSTYRKPGAIALISEQRRDGVISGGCLESDLEHYARQAIADQRPRRVAFDTLSADDLLFGSGSGCRGRINVLILPDSGTQGAIADALLAADAAHQPLELALMLDAPHIGAGACWYGDREILVTGGLDAVRSLKDRSAGLHDLEQSGGPVRAARFAVAAVPRILILGAGPETTPLLRIARAMGWRCLVADHRPAALPALEALAEASITARPAQALRYFATLAIDACIIMSHTASNDLDALRALGSYPVSYIGLLGPAARRDELLAMLSAEERAAVQSRLRAPIGINLGSHGPEPLALSIAAQLQLQLSGRA